MSVSKEPRVSRQYGITLLRTNRGWITEDGRFELYQDSSFIRYCNGPHPSRDGYCEGDQPHEATYWVIWEEQAADYLDRQAMEYDTLADAAGRMKAYYEGAAATQEIA